MAVFVAECADSVEPWLLVGGDFGRGVELVGACVGAHAFAVDVDRVEAYCAGIFGCVAGEVGLVGPYCESGGDGVDGDKVGLSVA